MSFRIRIVVPQVALLAALVVVPAPAQTIGQRPPTPPRNVDESRDIELDSLVALALAVNPKIHAAQQRVLAMRAQVGPAGALPDPMIGIGVINFPVSEPGFSDDMTMKTVGAEQLVPFPKKRSYARQVAVLEQRAAEADLNTVRLEVAASVRKTWYEIALLDHTLEIMKESQKLLLGFADAAESRYTVGTGNQQDILKARVEAARVAESAVGVAEQRRIALARFNEVLGRPSNTPVPPPRISDRAIHIAGSRGTQKASFESSDLGARVSNSPLPALEAVQDLVIANSPVLAAHEARIAAQSARVELARLQRLPDLNVSVQYGQRSGRSDMVNFMVSVPLALNKRGRQDQEVARAQAELSAMQAEHHSMVNELRADVADLYAQLERDRAQLALFTTAIIPQGRALLQSTLTAYQVDRTDFRTLIENQATLYEYQAAYYRSLAAFAMSLAELDRIAGKEVLQ